MIMSGPTSLRILGLLGLTFMIMVLVGRIFGRDALIVISLTCNLIMFGLTWRRWLLERIAASQAEQRGTTPARLYDLDDRRTS
jgi:hypothetical protein